MMLRKSLEDGEFGIKKIYIDMRNAKQNRSLNIMNSTT